MTYSRLDSLSIVTKAFWNQIAVQLTSYRQLVARLSKLTGRGNSSCLTEDSNRCFKLFDSYLLTCESWALWGRLPKFSDEVTRLTAGSISYSTGFLL